MSEQNTQGKVSEAEAKASEQRLIALGQRGMSSHKDYGDAMTEVHTLAIFLHAERSAKPDSPAVQSSIDNLAHFQDRIVSLNNERFKNDPLKPLDVLEEMRSAESREQAAPQYTPQPHHAVQHGHNSSQHGLLNAQHSHGAANHISQSQHHAAHQASPSYQHAMSPGHSPSHPHGASNALQHNGHGLANHAHAPIPHHTEHKSQATSTDLKAALEGYVAAARSAGENVGSDFVDKAMKNSAQLSATGVKAQVESLQSSTKFMHGYQQDAEQHMAAATRAHAQAHDDQARVHEQVAVRDQKAIHTLVGHQVKALLHEDPHLAKIMGTMKDAHHDQAPVQTASAGVQRTTGHDGRS